MKRLEETITKHGKQLSNKVHTPLPSEYRLKLDMLRELDPNMLKEYQEFVGILHWAVELGRIDVHIGMSMLSSHLACPQEGHY